MHNATSLENYEEQPFTATHRVRIDCAYDGSLFSGWAAQPNLVTVQGVIENALELILRVPHRVVVAGRTDAGVHAKGQVANFHIDWKELEKNGKNGKNGKNVTDLKSKKEEYGGKKTPDQIMDYINEYLPEDIAVLSCEAVPERFHSRLSAVKKTYCYQLEMGAKKDVFQKNYYYGLGNMLDVDSMKEAAAFLTGTHDFKSFCGNKKMKKTTVRTITDIEFRQQGSRLHIYFTGNGFLHNMVRILTGTLVEVGCGKIKPEDITKALDSTKRSDAGITAPPQGLFLVSVEY